MFLHAAIISYTFFLSTLLTLPLTSFGYFKQTDATYVGFILCSGITFAWAFIKRHELASVLTKALSTPTIWGSCLLALLSIVLSPFHPCSLMTWVGSPQLGEGVLLFLCYIAMSIAFFITLSHDVYKRRLLYSALITGGILSALTICGSQESPIESWRFSEWAPYFFPDFLGFVVIACVVYASTVTHSLRTRSVLFFILAIVAYYSSNKTLFFALTGGGILCALYTYYQVLRPYIQWAVILAIPLFFIGIYAYPHLETLYKEAHVYITMESRYLLMKSGIASLLSEPVYMLFTGNGWGRFADLVLAHIFHIDTGITLYKDGIFTPSWEFINRDMLHSHSEVTEAFLSLGWLGVLGIVVFYGYHVRHHKGALSIFYLSALITLKSFWFEFLHTKPFLILALLLVTRTRKKAIPIVPLFPIFSALLIGWGLWHGYSTAHIRTQCTKSLETGDYTETLESMHFIYDMRIGGKRASHLVRTGASNFLALAEANKKNAPLALTQNSYMAKKLFELHGMSQSLFALSISNNIMSELAYSDCIQTKQSHEHLWHSIVSSLIRLYPFRGDLSIGLMSYYADRSRLEDMGTIAARIKFHDPKNPIGLWFSGIYALNTGNTTDGWKWLQQAVARGIAHYMPIPKDLLDDISRKNTCN